MKNVMGVIYTGENDARLRELTLIRAIAALPVAGRYRVIDFLVSSMVNSGMKNVGVITQKNYQSLMDHLGSGKAWDLSRKNEGLYFLPPRSSDDAKYQGRIGSLVDVVPFLNHSKEDYVILADCHMVNSMDYEALLDGVRR